MSIFSRSVQNWESFFVFRLFICDYDILAAAFVEVAPHAERRRALLRYRYLVCRKGNSSAAAIRLRGKTAVYNGVSACVESKRSILFIHYNHSRREIERIGKARSAGAGIHFYSVGRRDFIFFILCHMYRAVCQMPAHLFIDNAVILYKIRANRPV
nr:MAG TPA: hypothetical protein [Caudoviricetes sp.]